MYHFILTVELSFLNFVSIISIISIIVKISKLSNYSSIVLDCINVQISLVYLTVKVLLIVFIYLVPCKEPFCMHFILVKYGCLFSKDCLLLASLDIIYHGFHIATSYHPL